MTQRALALDVGDARTGVALSDPLGITAQPHSTLEGAPTVIVKEVLALIAQHHVGTVVIGLPYELDGSVGPQANKVMHFTKKLNEALQTSGLTKVKVVHVDERLSTAQARRVMTGSKLKNKEYSAGLDRVSAAIILETYLQNCPKT